MATLERTVTALNLTSELDKLVDYYMPITGSVFKNPFFLPLLSSPFSDVETEHFAAHFVLC